LFLILSFAPKVEREILVTLLQQGSRLGASHAHSPSGLEYFSTQIYSMGKLEKIKPKAAGIDIGSEKIFVAIEGQEVKSFRTFTSTLQQAVEYLQVHGIESVAMEATGVYWVVLYDLLEQAGIEVFVVNPIETKNVPGRKTDVQDCQWIQQLHSYGLLRKSFIPEHTIRELRVYVRLREDHIGMASAHVQHMQKALIMMNIRLHEVISQIQGASGIKVIEAILSGKRDAEELASLCNRQILNTKKGDVIESLKGSYKREQLFALQQALDSWRHYHAKVEECDRRIELLLEEITKGKPPVEQLSRAKPIRHHKPNVANLHEKLSQMLEGKDPTALPGITDYSLMQLIAEVGTDFTQWPSAKHFTSWVGLAPGKNTSGKITKRSKKRISTHAGQIFRKAAQSLLQSKHIALGAFARRLKAKKGPMIAIKATARKLAAMFYNLMTKGLDYVEQGVKKYEEQYRAQMTKFLHKKAAEFGYTVVALNASQG
jgi:transposase